MAISLRNNRLYLASQSPRRSELLQQISVDFKSLTTSVDETPLIGEAPEEYVCRLAIAKARAGWLQMQQDALSPLPVLGADTSVVLGEQIIGKPVNREHGLSLLRSLSGVTHKVMTGVCLYYGSDKTAVNNGGGQPRDEIELSAVNITGVTFRKMTPLEIESYWDSGEPRGKAGAYGIQGRAAIYIDRIEGSYSSVVGLPLSDTYQMLEKIENIIRESRL